MNRLAPFRFALYLRSAYRAQDTHACGRTLSFPASAARLSEVRTPAPRQAGVPFRRSRAVDEGVGRDGTPLGKHVPQIADKPKENGANTMLNRITLIGRPSDRTQKPRPLRTTTSSSSSTSPPRRAGRTTRATTRPAPNGIASMPGVISRSSPGPSRRGSSSRSKGHFGTGRSRPKGSPSSVWPKSAPPASSGSQKSKLQTIRPTVPARSSPGLGE